jgi:hypothetical protein
VVSRDFLEIEYVGPATERGTRTFFQDAELRSRIFLYITLEKHYSELLKFLKK